MSPNLEKREKPRGTPRRSRRMLAGNDGVRIRQQSVGAPELPHPIHASQRGRHEAGGHQPNRLAGTGPHRPDAVEYRSILRGKAIPGVHNPAVESVHLDSENSGYELLGLYPHAGPADRVDAHSEIRESVERKNIRSHPLRIVLGRKRGTTRPARDGLAHHPGPLAGRAQRSRDDMEHGAAPPPETTPRAPSPTRPRNTPGIPGPIRHPAAQRSLRPAEQ